MTLICPYAPAFHWTRRNEEQELDLAGFVQALAGSDCRLSPHVMPRVMPAEEYLAKAAALYAGGAGGLAFWDTGNRMLVGDLWQAICQFGHREAVMKGEIDAFSRTLEFRAIGGHYAGPCDCYRAEQGY